ncbi:MAG: signal peptidase I [Chitinophagales bacterium]
MNVNQQEEYQTEKIEVKVPKKKKKSAAREWSEALLLAIIAATIIRLFFIEAYTIPTSSMEKTLLVGDYLFVSKLNYGSRLPMTPLAFPFAHNTMPFTDGKNSYSEAFKLPYYRLPGFQNIARNDVIVFNYPVEQERPVDKRENYIKRCVGLPGDTIEIVNRQLYINSESAENPELMQYNYLVRTNGDPINRTTLQKMEINEGGSNVAENNLYIYPLTENSLAKTRELSNVIKVDTSLIDRGIHDMGVFPNASKEHPWNIDNYGPIVIPAKDSTIQLTAKNMPLYEKIITQDEGNDLRIENGKVWINDKETETYTFKMNYYFMMGDNRHNSADSRYWGFVPEDHIVGKAVTVWFSLGEGDNFFDRIRWDRIFKSVD